MFFQTNTVIGHRGCKIVAQNNTIEAFLKAKEVGAEMVEMDVRKTRDGVLVIWHDLAIGNQRIRGSNFDELSMEAGSEDLILPTLEEVLKALEGKLKINVEIKEAGYEEEIVILILKYFTPAEFVITSFLDQSVLAVKKHFPTIKTGLILGVKGDSEFKWKGWRGFTQKISEIFPWWRMKRCGADFLAISWRLHFHGVGRKAFKRGIPTLIWTVNTPRMALRLLRKRYYGGIISDYPDMIVTAIKNL